jgi:hypothetical protein
VAVVRGDIIEDRCFTEEDRLVEEGVEGCKDAVLLPPGLIMMDRSAPNEPRRFAFGVDTAASSSSGDVMVWVLGNEKVEFLFGLNSLFFLLA